MAFPLPIPLLVAIVLVVLLLLIIRFVVKSAITLVKIGILVVIGVVTYFVLEKFVG